MSSVDFLQLPEAQRLAFVGLQLALAASDGHLEVTELALILECIDLEQMSPDSRAQVRRWMLEPPQVDQVLPALASGSAQLRFGVVVHLTDVVLADQELVLAEQRAMRQVREALGVSRDQGLAIEEFIWEVRRIRALGMDEAEQVSAIKHAASGLTAVAVPKAALLFSGSLLGLGKGSLAGLAALGLGVSVPGIGAVLALSAMSFMAMRLLLDTGKQRARSEWDLETQARIRRRQRNLGHLTVELRQWAEEEDHPLLQQRLESFERLVLAELEHHDPLRGQP